MTRLSRRAFAVQGGAALVLGALPTAAHPEAPIPTVPLSVAIAPLEGDARPDNDRRTVSVQVADDKARVLLVDSNHRVIAASDGQGLLSERLSLKVDGRRSGFYQDARGELIAFHDAHAGAADDLARAVAGLVENHSRQRVHGIDLQHRQIGLLIAPDDVGFQPRAVVEYDVHLVSFRDHVIVRDHET